MLRKYISINKRIYILRTIWSKLAVQFAYRYPYHAGSVQIGNFARTIEITSRFVQVWETMNQSSNYETQTCARLLITRIYYVPK